MTVVHLTDEQEDLALDCAHRRQEGATAHGYADKYAAREDPAAGVLKHLAGARGELAAAIVYRLKAHLHEGTIKKIADIGEATEVRCRSKAYYDLIVRQDDLDERHYVLVIGTCKRGESLNVVGSIQGSAAKLDEWVNDHGGHGKAWFVPQTALAPPERWSR